MLNSITPPDENDVPQDKKPDIPQDKNPNTPPDKAPDTPQGEKPEEPRLWKLNPKVAVEPRNMKELAADFGVSLRIARNYIKSIADKIGERVGNTWSKKQVTIAYNHFGYPKKFLLD